MQSVTVAFSILAALQYCPAFADTTDVLRRCQVIGNDQARLNCFDAVAKSAIDEGANAPEALTTGVENDGSAPTFSGKWIISEETDPISDHEIFTAILKADESTGRFSQSGLVVRCQKKSAEVYISWDEYLADETMVTVRFASGDPKTSAWSPSVDNRATFVPSWDVVNFLASAEVSDTLAARITPYNSGPVTTQFDLRGLSHILHERKELCGLPVK